MGKHSKYRAPSHDFPQGFMWRRISRPALVFAASLICGCSLLLPDFLQDPYARTLWDSFLLDARKSDLIEICRAICSNKNKGKGVPLDLNENTKKLLADITRPVAAQSLQANNRAAERARLLTVAAGVSPVISAAHAPPSTDLHLIVVNTGIPIARIDPAKLEFVIDATVLRALLLTALKKTYGEEDIDKAVNAVNEVTQLRQKSVVQKFDLNAHNAYLDSLWTIKDRVEIDAEAFGEKYIYVIETILAMPDYAIHDEYQLSSGRIIRLGSVLQDFHGPQSFTNSWKANFNLIFRTVFLHELGHLTFGHEIQESTSCARRRQMELEADAYSAAIRGLAKLDSDAPFAGGWYDGLRALFGSALDGDGQKYYFGEVYHLVGFSSEENARPTDTCYPSGSEREKTSSQINRLAVEVVNSARASDLTKCLQNAIEAELVHGTQRDGRVVADVRGMCAVKTEL